METIMQVLSDSRFYWVPVALGIAAIALARTLGGLWTSLRSDRATARQAQIRTDLRG